MRVSFIVMLVLGLPALLALGCAITGQSASVLEEEIVGCSLNTQIGFLTIGDEVQACYRDSSIYFVVDNTGSNEISGLSVSLESDYDITMNIRTGIDPGVSSPQNLNFGSQKLSGVRSLRVFPMIGSGDSMVVCTGAGISIPLERC